MLRPILVASIVFTCEHAADCFTCLELLWKQQMGNDASLQSYMIVTGLCRVWRYVLSGLGGGKLCTIL
jgi:hypothetical protein